MILNGRISEHHLKAKITYRKPSLYRLPLRNNALCSGTYTEIFDVTGSAGAQKNFFIGGRVCFSTKWGVKKLDFNNPSGD